MEWFVKHRLVLRSKVSSDSCGTYLQALGNASLFLLMAVFHGRSLVLAVLGLLSVPARRGSWLWERGSDG